MQQVRELKDEFIIRDASRSHDSGRTRCLRDNSLYRQIAAPNRTAHNASATFPVCRVPADPSCRKPL